MLIAVTGKSGQLTSALQALAAPNLEIVALGRPELDLYSPDNALRVIAKARPDVIVSSAAYTGVDSAEAEEFLAFSANRDGAKAIAIAASQLHIPIIHLSTDYVFNGRNNKPYVEADFVDPLSAYGRSKLEGEYAVAAATANHAILRTSWVYSTFGSNFVKTMLKLAETREQLSVVADQHGCPTSAHDIAQAIVEIAGKMTVDNNDKLRGVFHISGTGDTTWAGFARYVLSVLEDQTRRRVIVKNISTADYPTAARRPANSRLCCDKLELSYGIKLPTWQRSTEIVVRNLLKGKLEEA